MANVTSYNLADLTSAQAKAKGETFFRIWKQYQRKELFKRAIALREGRAVTQTQA